MPAAGGGYRVEVDGHGSTVHWRGQAAGRASVEVDGRRQLVEYSRDVASLHLWIGGQYWNFGLPDEVREVAASGPMGDELTARLPGTVARVLVMAGDQVAQGQPLLIIEAMKMEHTIRAPYAGRVSAVRFAKGERVTEGALLVDLKPAD